MLLPKPHLVQAIKWADRPSKINALPFLYGEAAKLESRGRL